MLSPENATRRTLFFCLFFLLAGAAGAAPKPIGIPPVKPPACNAQGKIESGPQGSLGEDCGTVAGGPCAYLDASYYPSRWLQGKDPEFPAFHPNGDFAWNGRCDLDDKGRQMVCVEGIYSGKKMGTCRACGEPGPGDNSAQFTHLGCQPKGKDCPDGSLLWPNGKCWKSSGLPTWECEADCAHHYNTEGWCSNGGAWWAWLKSVHPYAASLNPSYQKPICADAVSCTKSGLSCAAEGKACNAGNCVTECTPKVSCQKAGYPEGFQCFSGTCRLKP